MRLPPFYPNWPAVQSCFQRDVEQEQEIDSILQLMTNEEKIGQMIQPDIRGVTTDDIRNFKLGSVLNGGGGWPGGNIHATAADWVALAEAFWQACETAFSQRPFRIPFLWATDAVHGHNNVFGATVFPHNIGLGAGGDPQIVRAIGEATAAEVAATGLDWTFAPTVATPRHYGWGRVYEGYSEDPDVVSLLAAAMTQGLQGDLQQLASDSRVLATAKHWIGDGGTLHGVDRGENHYTEIDLINIHGVGYFSAIEAGVQTIMASFNSWHQPANYDHGCGAVSKVTYNAKIHGSKYLVNDVLKQQIGFDGLVISDWNGHGEVSGCSKENANYAINAGIDILMVTERQDWQAVYRNALDGLASGEIAQARVDDAVRRILRVKMRAGMWQKPSPMQRKLAGNSSILGCKAHRQLAREAVRKSLVLLKNNHQLLPLPVDAPLLIAGSGADDLQKQMGGWSLTWLGSETTKADFPGAVTLLEAITEVIGASNVRLDDPSRSEKLADTNIAVVVIGESPYAEMLGDIPSWKSLEFASLKADYSRDRDTIVRLKKLGYQVITVLYSGRPLYINEELNHSDAFVAAWLPGSEAQGITDLLFRSAEGQVAHDFTGRLTYSWPAKKFDKSVNRAPRFAEHLNYAEQEGELQPLFAYGYGLDYQNGGEAAAIELIENRLPLDPAASEQQVDSQYRTLFGVQRDIESELYLATEQHGEAALISANSETVLNGLSVTPTNYKHQQDARRIRVQQGCHGFLSLRDKGSQPLTLASTSQLEFDFYLHGLSGTFSIAISVQGSEPVEIEHWRLSPPGQWKTITISIAELSCFDDKKSPLIELHITGLCDLELGQIRISKT
jgi:beta-glucosidase